LKEKTLREQQFQNWEAEKIRYQQEQIDLNGQLEQLEFEQALYLVKAPCDGHVQELSGLFPGKRVFLNENIGSITPKASLIAECYISPKDVGLIRRGMPASFQMDAFDYNQWGVVKGMVESVYEDMILIEQQPVFKVRCSLSKDFLELKSGYKGQIKKGMAFQVQMRITEKSLWELLYQNVDEWVNPQRS